MKKTLPKTTPAGPGPRPETVRARLVGAFGLAALIATVALVSARPAHTAGAATAVQVTNVPLTTQDTNNPDLLPVQFTLFPRSTTPTAVDTFTVPAGKRLVIDYTSAAANHTPCNLLLGTTAGGNFVEYNVFLNQATTDTVNQKTQIYADPGTLVQAIIDDNSGAANAYIMISGHYVNVP